jgi:hypothetical protein
MAGFSVDEHSWDKKQTLWEIYSYLQTEAADLERYVTDNEDAEGQQIPPSPDQKENYYDGKTHALIEAMAYIEALQEDCGYIVQNPVEERSIDTACKHIKDTLLASRWTFADYQPQMTGEELLTFTGKNHENLQVIVTLEDVEAA